MMLVSWIGLKVLVEKIFEKHSVPLFKKKYENSFSLYLDKLNLFPFSLLCRHGERTRRAKVQHITL